MTFVGHIVYLCPSKHHLHARSAFRKNSLVFEFPIHRLPFLRVDTRSVETSLSWRCVRVVT